MKRIERIWQFFDDYIKVDDSWFMTIIAWTLLGGLAFTVISIAVTILMVLYIVLGMMAKEYPHLTLILAAIAVIWLTISYNGYKRHKKERLERQMAENHPRQMDYDK